MSLGLVDDCNIGCAKVIFIIFYRATGSGVPEEVGTATITLNIQNQLEFVNTSPTGCIQEGATTGEMYQTCTIFLFEK